MQGIVFDIQKFSIHDGPGIRTTVFLKGCPLRCKWCHNPESNEICEQLMLYPNLCTGCGSCVNVCPKKAIRIEAVEGKMKAVTDRTLCSICGACAEACPEQAREFAGRKMEAEEVIKEVLKDRNFYKHSGGGMTLSGGEVLMQPEFALDLLNRAKEEGLHTVVESCGFASSETVRKVYGAADLILQDIKHMDTERHKELTGVPNEPILSNIVMAAEELKKKLWIRLPLIKNINDSTEEIAAVLDFLRPFSGQVEQIWLLPYHNLGIAKLDALGQSAEQMASFEKPSDEQLERLKLQIEAEGYDVHLS